jgi:phosphohistidine phosphatase
MKTLLILRHAKSSWAAPGLSDHDRPLNDRGKRDAPRMGQLLLDENLTPGLILSSTAKRARKTASLVAKSCGYSREVNELADLYLAGPQSYFEALQFVDNGFDRVLVVGHNPGMEDLVQELVGEFHRMPTAALAHVELEIDAWVNVSRHVNCRLRNYWCPKGLE